MIHLNRGAVAALALRPGGGDIGGFTALAAAVRERTQHRPPNEIGTLNLFENPSGKWTDDGGGSDPNRLPHLGCAAFLKTNHDPQDLKAVNFRGGKKDKKKEKNNEDRHVRSPPRRRRQHENDKQAEESDVLRRAQVVASVPCVNGFADTGTGDVYPCHNVDLHSFIPLSEFTHPGESVNGNDVWGWTHGPSGREFALMGLTSGTAFVEITVPTDPKYVGFLFTHTTCSSWRDVKTHANHAFIVSEASGHGMQVFDMTQLLDVTEDAMPVEFQATAHYDGFGDAHNMVINEETGYAFAVGTDTFSGGLHIVNIQDPASPAAAGGFSWDGYTHDAQCVVYNGPDSGYVGREICFCYNEDTLTIVDVTDKASPNSPTQVGRVGYSGSHYTHQGWLTDDGRHVIVNDEIDERRGFSNTKTHVFNVEILAAPDYVGYHSGTSTAIDHNLYIKGDLVFEANYRAGLQVLRIDDAAAASFTEVANFDIYPSSDAGQFNGAWSNYPYFPSGNVVVSGIEQGLYVLGSSNGWGAGGSAGRRELAPAAANDLEREEHAEGRLGRQLQAGCQVLQDFESATAGSAADWSAYGSCSTGAFVVGTPEQMIDGCVVTQPGGDHTTGSGQALYSAPNSNPGNSDIDGGECVATSPTYVIATNSELTAWFFHGQLNTGDDANDFFALEASIDGGASWTSMTSIGDVSTRASWTKATYAGVVPAGAELRLRVRASDGSAKGDTVEAGIDDIVVCPTDATAGPTASPTPNPTKSPAPPPCPGQAEVTVNILTDRYPLETSWTLFSTCEDPDQIEESATNGRYQYRQTPHSDSYCVPLGEYRFEIRDSNSDGICCGYGSGNYKVLYDGVEVASGGEFGLAEMSLPFGSCGPVASDTPTTSPTNFPTRSPTYGPTDAPSNPPTKTPTDAPTRNPTGMPTDFPIPVPTKAPNVPELTKNPTSSPTEFPTSQPTSSPADSPTTSPPPTPTLVVASFDPSLGVPKCSTVGSSCSSGPELLDGKASNKEPNTANTLDECSDGSKGAYHSDESIDEIKVSTIEGGPLQGGALVAVEVKIWAWDDGSTDTADFYCAVDANDPNWEYIGSVGAGGSGLRTLQVQYLLPDGPLQAVRINFRYLGGGASDCSGGTWDDVDDLVFSVTAAGGVPPGKVPPPIPPVMPVDSGYCTTIDRSLKNRCIDICEWRKKRTKKGRKRGCFPKN